MFMMRKRHEGRRIAPNTQLRGENMSLKTSAGSPRRKAVAAVRSVHITLVKQENSFPILDSSNQGKQVFSQESAREAMDRV